MKIRIDLVENLEEDEVMIKCQEINPMVQKVQQAILDVAHSSQKLSFYKTDGEYFLSLKDILFFETIDNKMSAHTLDDMYFMKYRLYELEGLLPHNFIRISKSTILNIDKIYSIQHTLTSPNVVQFYKSHKQVYVSRNYLKDLKNRLAERRS